MIKKKNSTILFAPLDWGLGHTTRCIPLINSLQQQGFTIIVAVGENQKILLNKEFTNIKFLDLEGYNIYYTNSKYFFIFKLLLQLPKVLRRIYKERKWLNNIIDEEKIDLVISDNRFGLYSNKVPCVFITHQLTIKTPYKWLENFLQKINYKYINRFSECWIPDNKGENNFAGELSHPINMPLIPTHYIGILSRFKKAPCKSYFDICVLLSGPEPQRTELEKLLLLQLVKATKKKVLIVRGLPQEDEIKKLGTMVVKNHLEGFNLQKAILSSDIIIARSGYTTVMELLSLQKKAILIPTPGQTEQEYLAGNLLEQKKCMAYVQKDLDIFYALYEAESFDYKLDEEYNFNETKFLNRVGYLLEVNNIN